MRCQHNGEVK